jgi:hypothetical protein
LTTLRVEDLSSIISAAELSPPRWSDTLSDSSPDPAPAHRRLVETLMSATAKTVNVRDKKIAVSESNLRKAAARLLATRLVSTEIAYIQRELGNSATQATVDATVLAVRAMPWASIVIPD